MCLEICLHLLNIRGSPISLPQTDPESDSIKSENSHQENIHENGQGISTEFLNRTFIQLLYGRNHLENKTIYNL